ERSQDPESQLAPLRAAAGRLGWRVVRELSLKLSAWDDSAAAEVRRLALAPIESGEADTLLIWSWDRFSRQGIEGAFRELRHLEDHLGAQLYSLQESFLSTATADPQQRELMLSLIAWSAKWESQHKSARLKAKVQTKRARADSLGQHARWGRGILASWKQVRQVHALRAINYSVRQIAVAVGLSKSQVARILVGVPSQAAGRDADTEAAIDPLTFDDRDTAEKGSSISEILPVAKKAP
ncbi:MAG: recombinase family protein, partial [Pseudomonadota bacterium]